MPLVDIHVIKIVRIITKSNPIQQLRQYLGSIFTYLQQGQNHFALKLSV